MPKKLPRIVYGNEKSNAISVPEEISLKDIAMMNSFLSPEFRDGESMEIEENKLAETEQTRRHKRKRKRKDGEIVISEEIMRFQYENRQPVQGRIVHKRGAHYYVFDEEGKEITVKTADAWQKYEFRYLNGKVVEDNAVTYKDGALHFVLTKSGQPLQIKTIAALRRSTLQYSDGTLIEDEFVHIDFDNALYYVINKDGKKEEVKSVEMWKRSHFKYLNGEDVKESVSSIEESRCHCVIGKNGEKIIVHPARKWKPVPFYFLNKDKVEKDICVGRDDAEYYIVGENGEKITVTTADKLKKIQFQLLNGKYINKNMRVERNGAEYYVIDKDGERKQVKLGAVTPQNNYKYLDGADVGDIPVFKIGQVWYVFGDKEEKIWVKTPDALRLSNFEYLYGGRVEHKARIQREGANYFVVNGEGKKLFIKTPSVIKNYAENLYDPFREQLPVTEEELLKGVVCEAEVDLCGMDKTATKTVSTSLHALFPPLSVSPFVEMTDQNTYSEYKK